MSGYHVFLSCFLCFSSLWTLLHTQTCTHSFRVLYLLPSFPFSVFSPFLHSSLLPKSQRDWGSPRAVECVEVSSRRWSTMNFFGFVAMSSTQYLQWLCNDQQLHDTLHEGIQGYRTVCNNSTHLYWFNGLKQTVQFSLMCFAGVSSCIHSVCLSWRLEITCVQLWAASVLSLNLFSIYFCFG